MYPNKLDNKNCAQELLESYIEIKSKAFAIPKQTTVTSANRTKCSQNTDLFQYIKPYLH